MTRTRRIVVAKAATACLVLALLCQAASAAPQHRGSRAGLTSGVRQEAGMDPLVTALVQTEAKTETGVVSLVALAIGLGIKVGNVAAVDAIRNVKLKGLCVAASPLLQMWLDDRNFNGGRQVSGRLAQCMCARWDLMTFLHYVCTSGMDDDKMAEFLKGGVGIIAKKSALLATEATLGHGAAAVAEIGAKGWSLKGAMGSLFNAFSNTEDEHLKVVTEAMCEIACNCDEALAENGISMGSPSPDVQAAIATWQQECTRLDGLKYSICWVMEPERGAGRVYGRSDTLRKDGATIDQRVGSGAAGRIQKHVNLGIFTFEEVSRQCEADFGPYFVSTVEAGSAMDAGGDAASLVEVFDDGYDEARTVRYPGGPARLDRPPIQRSRSHEPAYDDYADHRPSMPRSRSFDPPARDRDSYHDSRASGAQDWSRDSGPSRDAAYLANDGYVPPFGAQGAYVPPFSRPGGERSRGGDSGYDRRERDRGYGRYE